MVIRERLDKMQELAKLLIKEEILNDPSLSHINNISYHLHNVRFVKDIKPKKQLLSGSTITVIGQNKNWLMYVVFDSMNEHIEFMPSIKNTELDLTKSKKDNATILRPILVEIARYMEHIGAIQEVFDYDSDYLGRFYNVVEHSFRLANQLFKDSKHHKRVLKECNEYFTSPFRQYSPTLKNDWSNYDPSSPLVEDFKDPDEWKKNLFWYYKHMAEKVFDYTH